ncbi:MAG: hypothetical protein JXC36_07980 [Candidatus Atribacteria bacterium]|nr:hypothetical protein [Candidatus Atribacteria bacterium]
MKNNKQEIKLPETCTFEKIKEMLANKSDLWLIGERKWTIKKNDDILMKEKKHQLPLAAAETGIFLTEEIDWNTFKEKFKDCIRLVFFNSEEQFQFIAEDNSCDKYLLFNSTVSGKPLEFENIQNTSKGNFQFSFARRLGAIPQINSTIKVIVDKKQEEWRLYYGLSK